MSIGPNARTHETPRVDAGHDDPTNRDQDSIEETVVDVTSHPAAVEMHSVPRPTDLRRLGSG